MRRQLLTLTLSQRILLAFAAAAALFVANTVYIVGVFGDLHESASEQRRFARAALLANKLDGEVLRIMLLVSEYAHGRGSTDSLQEISAGREQVAALKQELLSVTPLPAVQAAIARYDALLPRRRELADQIFEAVRAKYPAQQINELMHQRSILDVEARKQIDAIADSQVALLSQALAHDVRLQTDARRRILVVSLLNIPAIILIALLFVRNIKRRLLIMAQMAERIAEGDLSARAAVTGKDELDALSASLNAMAQKLADFEKVKDEFVAMASHQLRTPATAVKGNLGLLLEGYCGALTAEQLEILEDANTSNERQLQIIEDMLAVSRISARRMTIHKEPVDLCKLVTRLTEEHSSFFQERKQQVKLLLPAPPLMHEVDVRSLSMAIDNLISNASKYTPEGGRVEIRLQETEDAIEFSVIDSGVGISESAQSRLFRKFSRIDNPLSKTVGGSGLGLYLAREIVVLHGGTLTVVSKEGAGAKFIIDLPKGV